MGAFVELTQFQVQREVECFEQTRLLQPAPRIPITPEFPADSGDDEPLTASLFSHQGHRIKNQATKRVIDLPWVRSDLAVCYARLEAMKLLNWKLASAVATGDLNAADASAAKVFGTESVIEVYHRLLGILGAVGVVRADSPGAVLHGRIERAGRSAQINTFGGGVNEVQREIVAWMGLGLTRGAR